MNTPFGPAIQAPIDEVPSAAGFGGGVRDAACTVRKLRNVIVVCYLSHYPTIGALHYS